MNSKILLISLATLLIFFSGCIVEEAEPLDEKFTAFVGTWNWSGESGEISFTIASDGTGHYSENLTEITNFECDSFMFVDKSELTAVCKGISVARELEIVEFSETSLKLIHSELEEELNFTKSN